MVHLVGRYLPVYTLNLIFAAINVQDSNKHLNRSRYCSFLRETVACNRVCQHGVMGICEEFGSLNDMRLDSGVCLHICTDVSITPAAAAAAAAYTHTQYTQYRAQSSLPE